MMKEPEIKLFGRKIVLPESGGESEEESSGVDCDRCSEGGVAGEKEESGDKNKVEAEVRETMGEDKNPDAQSESDENSKTPSNDEDTISENHPKSENEATNGQHKTLKKPDKILPCPRCNSMDTKFCYYNNYNVNQPRHFCRSCQRYWTAGGSMRNVPVGAGRRKNKNATSHCRHITISEALQGARIDAPNEFHHLNFKPKGTVLSFRPNPPICESMASALPLTDKRPPNGVLNTCSKINNGGLVSCKNGKKIDDGSVMSTDGGRNMNGFSSPGPCIPGIPWPFPIAVYPPGYPLPYFPPPYLNYGLANAWNVPWLPMPSPATNQTGTSPSPSSPLGKHSRNGELIKPNSSDNDRSMKSNGVESSIVVPKTLRIDDPEEAAKSSIWDTLGIKYDSVSREGLFKALQPRGDEKKQMSGTSPLLQANPAALSRSISFQETA